MKKLFTLLIIGTFTANWAIGQINAGSPIPVDFVIKSPASIQGKYEYGPMSDAWGPILDHTVTGNLVWAYDVDGDSLCCESIVTDLTGKMALIRRGGCFFSQKVWQAEQRGAVGVIICNHYATATDNANTIINMAPANTAPWDSLAKTVTIPAVFVSRATCETILSALDNGQNVVASFEVRNFTNGVAAYSYHTPEKGIRPLSDIGVRYINLDQNELPSVTLTAVITDPAGQVTTISENATNLPGRTVVDYTFNTPYVPSKKGRYNVVFKNSQNSDEVTSTFVITDFTFAQDDNDIEDWIAPTATTFAQNGYRYDFGNFYRTGSALAKATHASFMLANPKELWTGDPSGDVFQIRLYDADPDGNGTVPGTATSYDALNESGGGAAIIGFYDYVLKGTENPYEEIIVEFEDVIDLPANKICLLMVQYNGTSAGIGIPPQYAYGGTHLPAGGLGECVYTDRLYVGGWNGDWKGVIRLHLNGFLSGLSDKALDKNKISVYPTPTSDIAWLDLKLDNPASLVIVNILDFNGRLVQSRRLENVHQGTFSFDVSNLAAGHYFMSVETPEGFRSRAFQVVR